LAQAVCRKITPPDIGLFDFIPSVTDCQILTICLQQLDKTPPRRSFTRVCRRELTDREPLHFYHRQGPHDAYKRRTNHAYAGDRSRRAQAHVLAQLFASTEAYASITLAAK
jgi:hypothetical protein